MNAIQNTLTGHAAIEYAETNGLTLSKHADPTEGAREGLSLVEAREVAAEDPSLIHVTVDAPQTDPRILAQALIRAAEKAGWRVTTIRRGRAHLARGTERAWVNRQEGTYSGALWLLAVETFK